MTTLSPKHKQEKDNFSSKTVLLDEKSNWSLEAGHLSPRKGSKDNFALVCDWLTTPGGAEKVLLELHHLYPNAPIYTSQYSKKGIDWFNDADVRTGWLQIFPKCLRKFLGPLRQIYFSHLDLTDYDLVISVTGAEAKSVKTKKKSAKPTPSSNYSTHDDKSQEKKAANTDPKEENNKKARKNFKNYSLSETALFDKESNLSLTVGELSPVQHEECEQRESPLSLLNRRVADSDFYKNRVKCPKHLCYCHVPTQYYWQMYDKYVENPGFGILDPLVRLAFKILVKPLRRADFRAAQQPDQFITISDYARGQIQRYYHRDAIVIPPPVEVSKFTPVSAKHPKLEDYFIIACRQVTWKRVDLAIRACQLAHVPLLVIGDGPEHNHLVKLAQETSSNSKKSQISNQEPEPSQASEDNLTKFLPWTPTDQLAKYLQSARAYLFPSLEPFGIAAVEALAAGCPVIAYAEGGSRDFIKNGKNGLLFDAQTPESLAAAIQEFQRLSFDRQKVSASAQGFSTKHFDESITALVNQFRKEIL